MNSSRSRRLAANFRTFGDQRALNLATRGLMLACYLFLDAQSNLASAATGNIEITNSFYGSTIHLRTSDRFAGAVSSLVVRGKEYIDTADHGRELQSALAFDDLGECFNPTEAGGFSDQAKQSTSSKLIKSDFGPNWLQTRTDMAFWLPPGFDYKRGCGDLKPTITHAINETIRGGYILEKRIKLGQPGMPNVISDQVSFTVPQSHENATVEAATLYTPIEFSKRYVLNLTRGDVESTAINAEQAFPVILATADDNNAVGLLSPLLPQAGIGYGTFNFPDTNKINCVFRETHISAGQKFRYECEFIVGTLDEVKTTMLKLHERTQQNNGE